MGAAREPDQADFDLERFIDMFDEALTSQDPRVVKTLRDLMMIVALTRPESKNPMRDRERGPLRRLYEDMNHLNRRLHEVEDSLRRVARPPQEKAYEWSEKDKYSIVAAQQVAQKMDQDIINRIKREAQIKAGFSLPEKASKGLYHK